MKELAEVRQELDAVDREIVRLFEQRMTLARDVAQLKEKGFKLQNAQAFDLFPRCAHVETVVTLSKLGM